ncbi:hypothetical protein PL9631_230020 [Planktothrix paucivesiculata PCC 9631]|uniref:Uncharacterized protein n=1 Tax=Planktothrix paucivesiculata PCC 9631 TaxID=671071 RepID=A0A7Z9BQI0_9CYAN|nr:hypothetical protein PL9631_230020 [Planktothrix paucivesiculata PCC 9631]
MIIGMRSPTFDTLYIACLRKSCVSKSFTEFDFSNLNINQQIFEDYKSRYLRCR